MADIRALKMACRLADGGPKDTFREFKLTFFPLDQTFAVVEILEAVQNGKHIVVKNVVSRKPHRNPSTGKFYSGLEFSEGAHVRVFEGEQHYEFVIMKVPDDLARLQHWLMNPPPEVDLRPPTPPQPPPKSEFEILMEKIRERIRTRTRTEEGETVSIGKLGKHFRICDDNGNGTLEESELLKALDEYRISLTTEEMGLIVSTLDRDGSGSVDYNEFLRGVRGEMNERRRALVAKAFRKLDATKNGVVDLEDISKFYNAKNHPQVLAGKATEQEILAKYLDNYDAINKDGKVTFNEFVEYYAGVSISIDHDDHFALLMYNAWKVEEDQI